MTRKTPRGLDDIRLKQVGKEGNSQIITRNTKREGGASDRAGGRDRPGLPEDLDQIILSSPLQQLRGVIGRYPAADQEFVFEFDQVAERDVHMVGVRQPLEVEWWRQGDLVRVEELKPWLGFASAPADRVVERRPARL